VISLISKQSSLIDFPVTSKLTSVVLSRPTEIIIESGVAVISFQGQHPTDWTRDSLSFPVGKATPQAHFLSGIASGSPASIWTDPPQLTIQLFQNFEPVTLSVVAQGSNSAGPVISTGNATGNVPGLATVTTGNIPAIGCAVDAATVAYSTQAGRPVATFALAVFGVFTFLLRVAYTVHIVLGEPGIVVGGGGVVTEER
jgi:hypothetical protein